MKLFMTVSLLLFSIQLNANPGDNSSDSSVATSSTVPLFTIEDIAQKIISNYGIAGLVEQTNQVVAEYINPSDLKQLSELRKQMLDAWQVSNRIEEKYTGYVSKLSDEQLIELLTDRKLIAEYKEAKIESQYLLLNKKLISVLKINGVSVKLASLNIEIDSLSQYKWNG